uniref:Retrovirus-related Pol polyprotein from transposon TNT 1-94 n=1 Tax=Tanacetum cinerariifolium TaxID=118510 RepID=A0A6L2KJA3_TANCI|nr:hypothetical protein [Tanacetum cinerariifolium]
MPLAKAEYIAAAGCYAQVLWIKSQLADYDVLYDNVPICVIIQVPLPFQTIQYYTLGENILTSEYSSQSQPKKLTPTLNVHFEVEDGNINFNYEIALLESKDTSYHPLLQFLKKSCISVTLTKQPSAYYLKYLRGFWYTIEVDTKMKTISFTLLNFDKPLSFDLDVFSSVIRLKPSENCVSLPLKETLITSLATLGLTNEKNPSLSSTTLINLSLPVTQPKALTNLKPKKKRIPHSSKPKSSKQVRDVPTKKKVTKTKAAEETVATADITKNIDASESVEESENQPQTAEFEKGMILKGLKCLMFDSENSRLCQINPSMHESQPLKYGPLGEYDQRKKAVQKIHSLFDTESEIKVIKRFEASDSNDEAFADKTLNEVANLKASADKPSQPLGHLQAEVSSLSRKVKILESSIANKESSTLEESVPRMVTDGLEERMPKLLSDSLKNILPQIIEESIQQALLKFDHRIKITLNSIVFDLLRKPLNKELNALNTLECQRFDNLQEKLLKAVWAKTQPMSIRRPRLRGRKYPLNDEAKAQGKLSSIQAPPTTKPIPSSSFALIVYPSENKFTNILFHTTLFEYSPTLPIDESKGKGTAIKEEPLKQLLPLIEQGGLDPKMLNLHHFSVSGKKMTLKDAQAQLNEMKRLADLKALQEKSEQRLKALSKEELEAQAAKKRASKILEEVFVKKDIRVDEMQRNLIPPPRVEGSKRLVSADIEGLAECKSSMSNLRRIQVKDIIKEVEDYLKTYSSAGMDINWYVEGIRYGSKESHRWQYSDYPVTL